MKQDTRIVHAGRDPERNFGIVNPPVYRASTILYRTLAEFYLDPEFATRRDRVVPVARWRSRCRCWTPCSASTCDVSLAPRASARPRASPVRARGVRQHP
jgi:cystathionine beta-lyase/cystathionine gamma-synthase